MSYRIDSAKPLPEPVLEYRWLDPRWQTSVNIFMGIQIFSVKKIQLKLAANWRPFCLGFNVLKLLPKTASQGICFWHVDIMAVRQRPGSRLSKHIRYTSIPLTPPPPPPPPRAQFRRRDTQMQFLERKVLYLDYNFIEGCSWEYTWQQGSIGWGCGLAPNRRQAITWTNVKPVHWRMYAALRGDKLRPKSPKLCPGLHGAAGNLVV